MTICTHCVMDISAQEITFNEEGVCNFCLDAEQALRAIWIESAHFKERLARIKTNGLYDCLIGLSGGVDSSATLLYAVRQGLRPLCFTVDTGYNKPAADENIMKLVEGLEVPFIRFTIDLQRFKELQGAFLRSGVRNIEIPTDHILMAVSYELAATYGIKTILSGGNVATESIMPASWGYNARDLTHIKAIYKQFVGKTLTDLPICGIWKWNWYRWIKRIRVFYLLDYYDYSRAASMKELEKFGFKDTGEKHEENYFTWWFQNWYLFTKFGIDKRKAHYSSMINSGQMSRSEAMQKLQQSPVFPELGIEAKVLKYPKHAHEDYSIDKWYGRIARLVTYVTT